MSCGIFVGKESPFPRHSARVGTADAMPGDPMRITPCSSSWIFRVQQARVWGGAKTGRVEPVLATGSTGSYVQSGRYESAPGREHPPVRKAGTLPRGFPQFAGLEEQ